MDVNKSSSTILIQNYRDSKCYRNKFETHKRLNKCVVYKLNADTSIYIISKRTHAMAFKTVTRQTRNS